MEIMNIYNTEDDHTTERWMCVSNEAETSTGTGLHHTIDDSEMRSSDAKIVELDSNELAGSGIDDEILTFQDPVHWSPGGKNAEDGCIHAIVDSNDGESDAVINNLEMDDGLGSGDQNGAVIPVFNPTSGEVCTELASELDRPKKEDVGYILQMLNLGGCECLIFYDLSLIHI